MSCCCDMVDIVQNVFETSYSLTCAVNKKNVTLVVKSLKKLWIEATTCETLDKILYVLREDVLKNCYYKYEYIYYHIIS